MPNIVETFDPYEGKDAGEVFFAPVVEHPTWSTVGVNVLADIQSRLFIYFAGRMRKITKKRTGCGSNITGVGVNVRREPIDVDDLEIMLPQCADIFSKTIYETAKKKGVEINDLTDTEIEDLLKKIVEPAILDDMIRIAWLSDKSLVADGDYNQTDGLFKRIIAGISGGTIVNLPIAAMATPADAVAAIVSVYEAQPLEMIGVSPDQKRILVDRRIYQLYERALATLGTDELSHVNMVNGVKTVAYMGVPIIPMDTWTQNLTADFPGELGNGRIVMHVADEALFIGVDAEGDETIIDFWYEKKDDLNYLRVRYKLGTKLKYHDYIVTAGFAAGSGSGS
jgi:hypothetical protein